MSGANPNRIRTSDLKSRLLHNSQTSVYQVRIQPPPEVSAHLLQYHKIGILDGHDIDLRCSEASLPATSFMTHEIRSDSIGVTERVAYRRIFDETVDFSFYVDRDYKVIEFFQGWVDYISGVNSIVDQNNYRNSYNGYRFKFPDKYRSDSMFITKFEKDVNETAAKTSDGRNNAYLQYHFIGAFPLTISSIPVSYASSDTMKCSVRMNYTRYVMDKKILTMEEFGSPEWDSSYLTN